MEDAVRIAKEQLTTHNSQLTTPPIVLLSPASPSYGMFKNFEERGNHFHACIIA
jgi:UDP-N-acetylmuramoylalanine-D-glutamate ligase